MKIGYAPLSKASWMTPEIEKIANNTACELAKTPGLTVVSIGGMITDEEKAVNASELFRRENIELLVLHFVTFPAGALIPAAVQNIDVPVVLLANPETAGEDKMWKQNSFCGANLGGFVMNRLGKKYSFLRALPKDTAAGLKPHIAAANCIRSLSSLKIGLAGGRVPGFYTSNFEEMAFRKKFGVTVEVLELLEIVNLAENLSSAEKKTGRDTVSKSSAAALDVPAFELEKAGDLLAAFRKAAAKYSLGAFAVRCWPEFSDIFGIAPCAVIGMLNDEGLPASCEGDVPGNVTMNILKSLAGGGHPIFVDLISYDEPSNTGVIWHCGAAPVSLCRKFEETMLRLHMRVDGGDKKGVTNDFPMKPGRVTIAKLDQDSEGKFRMLLASGTAVDTEPFIRGNPLTIHFDRPVGELIDTIMKKGFEHHYAAIHADVAEGLKLFCEWMNIEVVTI